MIRTLVRLYPRPWRDRYEEEFLALVAERTPTARDIVDVLRGALDAHLHPQAVSAGTEITPWTHRLPGLLAMSAGLLWSAGTLFIAFRSGPDWGDAGSAVGTAVGTAAMIMLICLPGDYLADHRRRVALGVGAFGACVVGVYAFGWSAQALVLGIGAYLLALCGLLVMAAIRAGIAPVGRWLLLAGAVLLPLLVGLAVNLLRHRAGADLGQDDPTAALLALPYGLAWLVVGLRMTVRGSPTIVDPPIPAFAPEVPA